MMNTLECIEKRKSTRIFLTGELPKECIEKILLCGMRAPSPKNSQPWHFCVVQSDDKKNRIAGILEKELQELKKENQLKKIQRPDIQQAFSSVEILRTAPVVIFVYMDNSIYSMHDDGLRWDLHAKDVECTHIQAIGAAIQNMLLAAADMGIDSLWMGDIFYAYHALTEYLGEKGCLMAAVALGYGADSFGKRSRKGIQEKVKWIS